MTTLLIVEDDEKSRRLLADVLTARGYTIVHTDRGESVLELAAACDPAAILLDIHLPGIDGFATLARLRADDRFARLPAVAVTASVMSTDRARVLDAGFAALLHKPVRLHELDATLQRLLAAPPPVGSAPAEG